MPDFARRSHAREWLDMATPSPAERAAYLKSLAWFNRAMLGHRPVLSWLDAAMRGLPPGEPSTLLDVGCGYGDLLRTIRHWANRRGLRMRLIGIDLNADTIAIAREATSPGDAIDYLVGDVFNLHPFGNALVVRKVKGSVLWAALENGLSELPGPNGGFPQIAGFKVVYDPAAAAGSRVVSVTLDDGTVVPKDDPKEIGFATVDFVNAGGDGYSMLIEPVPSPTLDLLTTVLTEYLQASSPVPASKGGRLVKKM